MNEVLDHKCPNCNSVLKFNPKTQKWDCEYCRGSFTLKELNYKSTSNSNNNLNIFICPDCGAKVLADENTIATSCVYCKNTAILKKRFEGEFEPQYIIPFKYTKQEAIQIFYDLKKYKFLMPKEFNNKNNINEITGIYIPFWLFDYEVKGGIEADCIRKSHNDTETPYMVFRSGKMKLENIPFDGSKKFDNALMNSIEPFNYDELEKFHYSYLSGFLAEKYDDNSNDVVNQIKKRIENTFIEKMKESMKNYNSIVITRKTLDFYNEKSKYVLLPVWLLNIEYNKKMYTFAINGQTGKIIGDIPISKTKKILCWIIIFLFAFIFIFSFLCFIMSG